VAGVNNVLPVNAYMDAVPPLNKIALQASIYSSSVITSASLTNLDITPNGGSKLLNAAQSLSTISQGYEIPNPLLKSRFPRFSKQPILMQPDLGIFSAKSNDTFLNIGAY
jgi:hypothetical protein